MVKIEILKPDEIDVKEIVQFMMMAQQQLDEQLRSGNTEEEVKKYIKGATSVSFYYILAREDRKLVGLAGLYVMSESMVYLDPWNPLVLPGNNSDELFQRLVKEAIKQTRSLGRTRLEVFLMKLTDDIRHNYHRVRPLYEAGGMRRGNEWTQMWCDLTSSTLKEPIFPDGFTLKRIVEVDNEEIWPTYNDTFLSSGDNRYLNQTETQRRENFDNFFDKSKPIEEDASLLLYDNDQVVGFMKINIYDIGGFVNGIGIHPDYRRRGLARKLMTASLVRARENEMENVVLEVDIENRQAIALYEQLGFISKKGSISHIWTA
ncbi:MAG: GNAT family N-acetyltransferase [Candidatus Thorarchaeota archaeon]